MYRPQTADGIMKEYQDKIFQREKEIIQREKEKPINIERMKDILAGLGIEMMVGGCGCCGSPWITFKYKGEAILDDAKDVNFSTINE